MMMLIFDKTLMILQRQARMKLAL